MNKRLNKKVPITKSSDSIENTNARYPILVTRTVFMRANSDGVRSGPVPHAGPREHPYAVLGPATQLVQ